MDDSKPRHLVLVGGGHAHAAVLKRFGLRPPPEVRITLISPTAETAYSGMIPGYIAGHYHFREAHLDLPALARFAGADFIQTRVNGLDLENKLVLCEARQAIPFDLLSLNTGSTPGMSGIPGAREHTLPVKPMEGFLLGWDKIIRALPGRGGRVLRIAIVGGGAGGVELALATNYYLSRRLASSGASTPLEFHLVADSATLLPTHNLKVRGIFARILKERMIRTHLLHRVVAVVDGKLICHNGTEISADVIILATPASAPSWINEAGLQTDNDGFVAVNDSLQSWSHPFIFAAGDVATSINHPRPKAGVFAVRQGPPLAENLRRACVEMPLLPFYPQREFLSIISTGGRYAVASRGAWAMEGAWVWKLKDWIDRRWMRQYQHLPTRPIILPTASS